MKKALLILFLSLSIPPILSCELIAGPSDKSSKPRSLPATLSIPEERFSESKVMEEFFGNYSKETSSSIWTMSPMKSHDFRTEIGPVRVVTTILAGVPPTEKTASFLLGTRPVQGFDCHSCGVLISVLHFERTANRSYKLKKYQELGLQGSFGEPPSVKSVKIGKERYGYQIESGYSGQGLSVANLSILGYQKKGYATLFDIEKYNSNQGMCAAADRECRTVSKEAHFIESKKKYYDIEVKTVETVTDRKGKALSQKTKTESYTFKKGKYEKRK